MFLSPWWSKASRSLWTLLQINGLFTSSRPLWGRQGSRGVRRKQTQLCGTAHAPASTGHMGIALQDWRRRMIDGRSLNPLHIYWAFMLIMPRGSARLKKQFLYGQKEIKLCLGKFWTKPFFIAWVLWKLINMYKPEIPSLAVIVNYPEQTMPPCMMRCRAFMYVCPGVVNTIV